MVCSYFFAVPTGRQSDGALSAGVCLAHSCWRNSLAVHSRRPQSPLVQRPVLPVISCKMGKNRRTVVRLFGLFDKQSETVCFHCLVQALFVWRERERHSRVIERFDTTI